MQLPQIEDSLLSVTDVIVNGKIKDKVNSGLREFDKIQQDIQNAVKDLIPQVSQNMRRAGMPALAEVVVLWFVLQCRQLMNWKELGNKQLWPYPSIYLDGLRKTMKNLIQDS
jgi:hypothetical protein